MYNFPRKCDGALLHCLLTGSIDGPEFLRELGERGYQMETLRLIVDGPPRG